MKKALSLILALAMALSLAACGGGKTETPSDSNTPADNTSAEPTKLSLILRGGTYADVIKECLPAFEAEHNVVCEVQELSEGDLYSGIALDAINDKGSYDLCMVDGSWMAEFTENGVLANLTELGYSLDEDVIPATTTICYVGDDLYLAPYYGNVTVLLYNKANVEAAGYTGDTILSSGGYAGDLRKGQGRRQAGLHLSWRQPEQPGRRLPAHPAVLRRLGHRQQQSAHRQHSRV